MSIVSLYDAIDGVAVTPSANSLALASFFVSPCNKLQVHVVSRQMGTSTTIALSAAVDAINSPNKVICILCRFSSRQYHQDIIRQHFSQFLDVPNNRDEIRFLNNSKILFRAITSHSLRGMTVHRTYVDAEVCNSQSLIDLTNAIMPTVMVSKNIVNICLNYHPNTVPFITQMKNNCTFVMEYPQFDKQHMLHIIGATSYAAEFLCKGV